MSKFRFCDITTENSLPMFFFNNLTCLTPWEASSSASSLPVAATHAGRLGLHLPLPEQVADGGVLHGQGVGQERHQAPEALPQILHVLLQAVDVRVQLPPAALHLGQHVVHQALHLCGGLTSTVVRSRAEIERRILDATLLRFFTGWDLKWCVHLPLSPCQGPLMSCFGLQVSSSPSLLDAAWRQRGLMWYLIDFHLLALTLVATIYCSYHLVKWWVYLSISKKKTFSFFLLNLTKSHLKFLMQPGASQGTLGAPGAKGPQSTARLHTVSL